MNETRISSSEKNTATKRTISSNISSDGVELFRKTSERIGSLSSSESDWTHDEREAMTAWRLFEAAIHNKETIESYGLLILHHQQQAGTPPPQTTGTTTAPIIYYTQRLAQVLDCFQTLAWWESSIEAERHYCLLVSDAVQKNLAQHNQPTNALNANHQALLLTAESLYYQGRYHVYLSRPTEAGKAYSRALELLELLQQQKWNDIQEGNGNEKDDLTTDMFFGECIRGDVLVALSGLHFHEKEFDKAIEILSQAELEYSSKNTLPIIIGEAAMHKQHRLVRCLQQQGLVYRTLEKYELALQVYQRAVVELNISGRKAAQMGNSSPWFSFRRQVSLEDNSTETTALELKLDQADMHMALDQYDTALEMYESLLYSDRSATTQDLYACVDDDTDPTAKETDDDLTTAILWHNIGKIHAQNGQCGLAVSCLKRSLRVKRRVLDAWHHPELAKTLHALGSVHAILHDKGKAMACFREAMLMARARVPIGDSPDRDPHVIQAMYNLTLLERGSPA